MKWKTCIKAELLGKMIDDLMKIDGGIANRDASAFQTHAQFNYEFKDLSLLHIRHFT
jgi:hypothetical protein